MRIMFSASADCWSTRAWKCTFPRAPIRVHTRCGSGRRRCCARRLATWRGGCDWQGRISGPCGRVRTPSLLTEIELTNEVVDSMAQMTPEVSKLLEKALSLSIEEQEALAD